MSPVSDDFDFLLLGVVELLRNNREYPYPDTFARASHMLALKLSAVPVPRTVDGILALFARPVNTWCPYPIPSTFYAKAGLVEDGHLSEEAANYFYNELIDRAGIPEGASAIVQLAAIENYRFRQLLDRLIEADDRERAEAEYVLLRSFLIDNPHTTTGKLRDAFWQAHYIQPHDVGSLYDDWPEHLPCWTCEHCGPLTESRGRLRGVKPSLCDDHRPDLSYVRQIPWERGLRRIKLGVHWRVCLPGIPEMCLYRFLCALHEAHPQKLVQVRLWPGIDRYDIQIRFEDEAIWAVDIKDYRDPDDLARKLTPFYGEGLLRYDESFYVVPTRRIRHHEGYIDAARYAADRLPSRTHILSEPDFCARVTAKLNRLLSGRPAYGTHPV